MTATLPPPVIVFTYPLYMAMPFGDHETLYCVDWKDSPRPQHAARIASVVVTM